MSYQLLALDLDGTILDRTMVLDPSLRDALRLAATRGLPILRADLEETVGTARLALSRPDYLELLPANASPLPEAGGLLALFAELSPEHFG